MSAAGCGGVLEGGSAEDAEDPKGEVLGEFPTIFDIDFIICSGCVLDQRNFAHVGLYLIFLADLWFHATRVQNTCGDLCACHCG